MIIVKIVLAVIFMIGLIVLGISIASCQNSLIDSCFRKRERHDKLLIGELTIKDISDFDLISLSRPMFTHIGMGGIGPHYNPSFTVLCLIDDELTRRRSNQSL